MAPRLRTRGPLPHRAMLPAVRKMDVVPMTLALSGSASTVRWTAGPTTCSEPFRPPLRLTAVGFRARAFKRTCKISCEPIKETSAKETDRRPRTNARIGTGLQRRSAAGDHPKHPWIQYHPEQRQPPVDASRQKCSKQPYHPSERRPATRQRWLPAKASSEAARYQTF